MCHKAGVPYILSGPAPRHDPSFMDGGLVDHLGRSATHGSLWTTSTIIDFIFMRHAGDLISEVAFAQCELSSTTPRYTSLILSSSLLEALWQLGDLRCTHQAEQHWILPPDAAALITMGPPADHAFLPSSLLDFDDDVEVDSVAARVPPSFAPPPFINNSHDKSPFPWDSAPGADTDGEEDDPAYAPPHFFPISQRLPSRAGAPRHIPVPALAATIDPRGHRQAMKAPKAEEWRAAELAELQNHTANGSFREMNRGDARRLADSHGADFNVTGCLWVYKTKRDGRRKARLCLNGAS